MLTTPLSLDHQKTLTERFRELNSHISEYTFANAYLFRDIHQFEVVSDFEIFLKGKTRDGFTYLMPTRPLNRIDISKLLQIWKEVDFLFPIQEEWMTALDPTLFAKEYNPNDSDYLYATNKMRTYPGRHLAGRRNLVKQFKETYPVKSFPLAPKYVPDALTVLEEWRTNSHQDDQTDYAACREALEKIAILGLSGIIYCVDTKPVGFVLGEELNKETYVIHFAKTNVLYKGIYQYMYQDCAQKLDDRFQFINLEQDLGEPGLGHAKRAYQPEKLIPKYRLIVA